MLPKCFVVLESSEVSVFTLANLDIQIILGKLLSWIQIDFFITLFRLQSKIIMQILIDRYLFLHNL